MIDSFTRKRLQEAEKLNPRDLLLYILDLIDSGEIAFDGVTVVGYKKVDNETFTTEYFRGNLDPITEISLHEMAKNRLLRRMMG